MARRTAAEAAETRRRLLDAAGDVFAECGYNATTLGQVAGRAGLTRGALYHHFADKAEIYDTVLRREVDQVTGPLMAGLAGDGPPLQRLREFVVAYCTALDTDPQFRRAVELLLFAPSDAPDATRDRTREGYRAWLHAFETVLDEARVNNELRPDITPRMAAGAVIALTVGATTAALHAADSLVPAEHAEALADTLVAGLAQPPG
ncbi:MAG TPA: TetR/AcrR family transcriptional regulator [Euzebyales bacterium]